MPSCSLTGSWAGQLKEHLGAPGVVHHVSSMRHGALGVRIWGRQRRAPSQEAFQLCAVALYRRIYSFESVGFEKGLRCL